MGIYESFERAIKRAVDKGRRESCAEGKEGRRELVLNGLRRLCPPKLERAGRLRRDLERLGANEMREAGPRLKALTQHISTSTPQKPHLLLAYAWLLYMALFSGGRYIRARLREAGSGFWTTTGAETEKEKEEGGDIDINEAVLSFWNFPGEEDGEDVKAEFKERFAKIERWLTGEERDEVMQEAVYIMDSLLGVVKEIAEAVGSENTCREAAGRHEGVEGDGPSVRWLCLKHILPMGMFELITGTSQAVVMGVESLSGKTSLH